MTEAPDGWIETTLGQLGRYLNGRGFKKSEWRDSGRPIIRIQNLTGTSQTFNYFDGEAEERHIVRDGDLLVSWSATLGVFEWGGPEAVLNQHIFKVESFIDPPFHAYLLKSVLADLYQQTHGSGMVHITKGKFDSTPVLLPPLAEQQRIVAEIEEHLSDLDAAQSSLQRAAARLHVLRSALISSEIDGRGALVTLESLAATRGMTDGPFGSHLKSSHYTPNGPRVIRLENIGAGEFIDEKTHISEEHYGKLTKHAVAAGDVLIASLFSGSLRACLAPNGLGPAIVKADCIRVRLRADTDPRYVNYALQRPDLHSWCAAHARGVGRQRLGLGNIRQLPVPIADLPRQREVADMLDSAFEHLDLLHRQIVRNSVRGHLLRAGVLAAGLAGRLRVGAVATGRNGGRRVGTLAIANRV